MSAHQHQAAKARKLRSVARAIAQHFPPHLPALLCLTDPERTPDPVAVASMLGAGMGLIYRHFGAETRLDIAWQLAKTARERGLVLLIAADPDLALAVGAQGVHWPESRLSEARRWRGAFALQTASAHSRQAIARAQAADMDAALISSVFASKSKSAGRPMGPLRLRQLALTTDLPVYGLGGLTASNAERIAGIAGMAAIDGFQPG